MQTYLEERIHSQIPIAKKMGVKVKQADREKIVLTAPLLPNHNHKCTVFGGSLASIALLCGWCAVVSKLKEWGLNAHVVVSNTEINFRLPVEGDFEAVCELPEAAVWDVFRETLYSQGKARITLHSLIPVEGKPAVRLSGVYVGSLSSQ